jgi:hypothetical protein
MTIKRLLFLSLFLTLAFNFIRVNAYANTGTSAPINALPDTQEVQTAALPSSLSVALEKGLLQIKAPTGTVLSGVRLRLRFDENSALIGELQAAGQDNGTDAGGKYERQRYRFKADAAMPAPLAASVKATLEVRRYLQPETIVAFLDYDGPALAARAGIQLIMALDKFERGMALKRFKLYWTSPVFTSDARLLSSSNQLLLWRQIQGDKYNLLVPLAGDGMIGEVGVSEIDFRPTFRVSASSYDPKFAPHHVPLFAYATSDDPYRLPVETYQTAFAASEQYGRLRWQKSYPEIFSWLGWCSWNAYEKEVTEEKVLGSVRSIQDKQIPIGFVLVDDGWLSTKDNKLTAFGADKQKFPNDLSGLAKTLRGQYHIRHVGVWHTFQGYWSGVDNDSEIARTHKLYKGLEGKALPDPRAGAGESFYTDWYSHLKDWGYDFVKVDGQSNNVRFTNTLMPLFSSGGGEHRNFQEAAQKFFSDSGSVSNKGASRNDERAAGLNVINCMEMTLENTYNWRVSNVARNSDDYLPDSPQNVKEHVYQNAYNAYWISNFAYPDWDMFQSHDAHAEFHAVARAISGGPIYFTDKPGQEHPEILRRLAASDGRLLMLDEPGQVTRDTLLTDTALEPVALKMFGLVSRPGLKAGIIAAFNVNKSAPKVSGEIKASDIESIFNAQGEASAANATSTKASLRSAPVSLAVYQRSSERATLLDAKQTSLPFTLDGFGFDLFTLVPVQDGAAIFGLLNKYLGTAAIVSQQRDGNRLLIRLREAGDFGAWLERAPSSVKIDGRELPKSVYSYRQSLLRVPQSSFGSGTGEREMEIVLGPRKR